MPPMPVTVQMKCPTFILKSIGTEINVTLELTLNYN